MSAKNVNNKKPIALDIFSGCGGLSEGLRQAGFRVAGAVEIDATAAAVYRLNHKETPLWERDITRVRASEILDELLLSPGELDLIAGCPPCQGFSTLRTLNGGREIEDARNDLIYQFLRLVKQLQPKTVMMENVPGLAKDKRFHIFVGTLERLGYKVNWNILDAADYAVPQRRRRLILLASRLGKIGFSKKSRKNVSVRDAIESLPSPGSSPDLLHNLPERRSEHVRSLIANIPKNGGSRKDLAPEYQLACHQNCNGFKDVYGRMAWDHVAPTITTGCFNPSKGRFLHPDENRNITMREAALLQTFPRRYRFPANLGKQKIELPQL